MLQPQSDESIESIRAELRRLDPLVDVRWEPKARMIKPGWYNADAGKRHDPEYDGRWQVVRYDTPNLHDRTYVVLVTITEPVRVGKRQILMMQEDGPYAPVESWLIEYMQTYDAAQRAFAAHMDAVWDEHERVENTINDVINDQAAHQEAAEKIYREHGGGEFWMGRGFGKGKRTTDQPAATSAIN